MPNYSRSTIVPGISVVDMSQLGALLCWLAMRLDFLMARFGIIVRCASWSFIDA